MSVEFLKNQPIRFDDNTQLCLNRDDAASPLLMQYDDTMCIQVKVNPCGDPLCGFTDIGTTDWLSGQGSFTGGSTGWTLGANWTYGSDAITHTGAASSFADYTTGAVVGTTQVLRITMTVSHVASGGKARFYITGANPVYGQWRSATGTYIEDVSVDASMTVNFTIEGEGTGAGSQVTVDDVIITSINDCWTGISLDEWDFDPDTGEVCHVTGNTTPLATYTTPVVAGGDYWKVVIKVKNMTQGSITPVVGDMSGDAIITNGEHIQFIVASTSTSEIEFVPTSDFDGCLYDVAAYDMTGDITGVAFYVANETNDLLTDGVTVENGGGDMEYYVYNDYITWCFNLQNVYSAGDPVSLATGCYKIAVLDTCFGDYQFSTTLIQYNQNEDYWPCTKVMVASNSNIAYGFYFGTETTYGAYAGGGTTGTAPYAFEFILRLRLLKIMPQYPASGEEHFYSTGRHIRTYATSQKMWTLWLDKLSEAMHDCVRLMVLSDTLEIDTVEYYCPTKDYEPEWAENQKRNLARAKVGIQLKSDILFNFNC